MFRWLNITIVARLRESLRRKAVLGLNNLFNPRVGKTKRFKSESHCGRLAEPRYIFMPAAL